MSSSTWISGRNLVLAISIVVAARLSSAQNSITADASSRASFEVATIKPSDPLNSHQSMAIAGGRLTATTTVKNLIERAYDLRDFQIVGAPKWLGTAKYDIVATADEKEDPSKLSQGQLDLFIERQKQRVQSLLVDRFQLKFHLDRKELPIYELVVAGDSPKLRTPKAGEAHRLYTQAPGQPLLRRVHE
jgi:uncharacterized protein (TIGR03435 family)